MQYKHAATKPQVVFFKKKPRGSESAADKITIQVIGHRYIRQTKKQTQKSAIKCFITKL